MVALEEKAGGLGGKTLVLDARTHAIEFYKRFGFQTISEVFASGKTGMLHVTMQKYIRSAP